jgi:hypothetical protein
VDKWLQGDPAFPTPSASRKRGRNARWRHLYAEDVLSMPDKWEYPWFAGWDLCFHTVVLAMIDPDCAKEQLSLLVREWYMHPEGQVPATSGRFPTPTHRCQFGRPGGSTRLKRKCTDAALEKASRPSKFGPPLPQASEVSTPAHGPM